MRKSKYGFSLRTLAIVSFLLAILLSGFGLSDGTAIAQDEKPQFTTQFRLEDCVFNASGTNPYFSLEPGYTMILEGEADGVKERVVITVLPETKDIVVPDLGTVTTRIILEEHTEDGEIVEISRNYFAICEKTNAVYYFGEDVDIFNPDGTITHEGAWLAGAPDGNGLAEPGLIMPGTFLLGSRYYQEIADDIALDRAKHTKMELTITTPAGTFEQCVQIVETTPLEPGTKSVKIYCPDVGLVVDDVLELVQVTK